VGLAVAWKGLCRDALVTSLLRRVLRLDGGHPCTRDQP
jgi:hypothetical protein